jgi:hypothetical protein
MNFQPVGSFHRCDTAKHGLSASTVLEGLRNFSPNPDVPHRSNPTGFFESMEGVFNGRLGHKARSGQVRVQSYLASPPQSPRKQDGDSVPEYEALLTN